MRFFKLLHIPSFLIKKPLKNRYTRKQPTHFSMTPSRPKRFFKNPSVTKFGTPKKMMAKSQAKIKPSFL